MQNMTGRIGAFIGDVVAIAVIIAFIPLWFLAWLIGGRR